MAEKTFVFWSGKGKWFNNLVIPDVKFNKWNFLFYPNEEHLNDIRELQGKGVKNVLSKDEDGWKINLGRPVQKTWQGKIIPFAPPVIVDADGRPLTGVAIGNGSEVTAKVEVYQHAVPGSQKRAHALRLEGVMITNLIPFEKNTDFPQEQKEQVEGLITQKKVPF